MKATSPIVFERWGTRRLKRSSSSFLGSLLMTKKEYHFTGFSDETGSITNNQPEIFGGSLFVIENSEIAECRAFLKEHYPNGIHCSKIRSKNTLQKNCRASWRFFKK